MRFKLNDIEDFRNTKITFDTQEQSEIIQKHLFSIGIEWLTSGSNIQTYVKYGIDCSCRLHRDYYRNRITLHYNDIVDIDIGSVYQYSQWGKISTYTIKEEKTMEDINKFNKENLKIGKEKVEEERATYEQQCAANKYRELIDLKEKLEREMIDLKKAIKDVKSELKVFE